MTTQDINDGLQIVKINGKKFGNKKEYVVTRGYAFYHKELGYFSFKTDNKPNFPKNPYSPISGKKGLERILNQGGFLDFDCAEWLQELR